MAQHETRKAYLDQIYNMICQGEDIIIVSADLAAPSLDILRKEFPNRFVSVGIAEQNLISISCGLALAGKRVIAYSANPFPALRALDQIRNAVVMMNLPISIVAIGAGFSIPEYGATHYCTEDISLMRTCGNIKTISISDEGLARKVAHLGLRTKEPLYIKFDRIIEGTFAHEDQINFTKGFRTYGEGNDIAIITSGNFTKEMYNNIDNLNSFGVSAKLIDLFSIPFDEREFILEIEKAKKIITIEEHILQGGLGSVILEVLADYGTIKPIKRLGLNFSKGYPHIFGSREYLLEKSGLSVPEIIKKIIDFSK